MNKQELINKYKNEEDKLLVSKILDKIKLAKTKNQITNTEFLDMYQKKLQKKYYKQKNTKIIYIIIHAKMQKKQCLLYIQKNMQKFSIIINSTFRNL